MPFPVFCQAKRNFDAEGAHFAVQAAANPLLPLEVQGREYGRPHEGEHPEGRPKAPL